MSVQRCPRCKGEGSVTVTYDDYGMADPKDVMCPVCGGNRFVSPATREAQRSGVCPNIHRWGTPSTDRGTSAAPAGRAGAGQVAVRD
jgi:hypothetical protein